MNAQKADLKTVRNLTLALERNPDWRPSWAAGIYRPEKNKHAVMSLILFYNRGRTLPVRMGLN